MPKNFSQLSDEKLVELICSDQINLYEILIKRYQEKLLRYAYYLTNNWQEAEDIVQETFIKTYENLFRFNLKKKFSSWLYRICHNEAINFLKRKRINFIANAEIYLKEVLDNEESSLDKLIRQSNKRAVKKALQKMPLIYKEVLILYFFEEKKYEEISDILRQPINTVATRIRRAKAMLKKILSGGKNGKKI